MARKKFSEVKQGDTIYFLIDRFNILQTHGGHSVGFANSNYGLIICSRKVANKSYDWHSPRTDNGLLVDLCVDIPITYIEEGYKARVYDDNGVHLKKYPDREITLVYGGNGYVRTITKKDGEESCLQIRCRNSNYYSDGDIGYIYTTKEELEERIKEVTDDVENNLRKIKETLNAIE